MRRILHLAFLSFCAVAGGMIVQCSSNSASLHDASVDAFIRDMLGIDDHSTKADASSAGANDWFTLSYQRNDGTPDSLSTDGSDVSVPLQYRFASDKPTVVVSGLSLRFLDATTQRTVQVIVTREATGPGKQPVNSSGVIISELEAKLGAPAAIHYNCSAANCTASGTLEITKFGLDLVGGTFDIAVDLAGEKRRLAGQFEAEPPPQTSELRP